MIHVLQSYCIVSAGVRITCSNQNGQGKRSTVLSTSGSQSMRDNIGAIFGPKQVGSTLFLTILFICNLPKGVSLTIKILKSKLKNFPTVKVKYANCFVALFGLLNI